jgi:hypothetical protein
MIDPNEVVEFDVKTKDGYMKFTGHITNMIITPPMTNIRGVPCTTIQFEMMALTIEKLDGTKSPIEKLLIEKLPIGRILS